MQLLGDIFFEVFTVIAIICLAITCIKINTTIRIATVVWNKTSNYEFVWKALIYVIPVAGLLGVIIPTMFGLINLTMLGIYLALPMISAPLIYYLVFVRCPEAEAGDATGG